MKAVIIDDEQNCIAYLAVLLQKYCPDIEILATFTDPLRALHALPTLQPDIVFLDIEMPQLNGFDLLGYFQPQPSFVVVFTTAYDKYAIQAFKFGAIDYLLKPIQRQELSATLERISVTRALLTPAQLQFAQQAHAPNIPDKIALSTAEGLHIVPLLDIIYCESDGCYTKFYLKNTSPILLSKPIKDATELLENAGFLRVHHSFLVNMKEVKKYIRGEGGELVMSNDAAVPVSRTKKNAVLAAFTKL